MLLTVANHWAYYTSHFGMSLLLVNRTCRPIVIYFENKLMWYAWCSCISCILCGSRMSKRNNRRWHVRDAFVSYILCGSRMTGVKRNTKMAFLYHAFCVAQELRETKKEKMAQEWRKTKEAKMPCLCDWQLAFCGCCKMTVACLLLLGDAPTTIYPATVTRGMKCT